MNTTACFFRRIEHVSTTIFLLVVFFISAGVSPVQAGESVSFSWRANPVEDEVVGYRLYYGDESRFTAGSYDYYIDFTSWQRCPGDRAGLGCEPLAAGTVSCQDLFREAPQCTVYNLQGRLYFALTAYSAQDESDYTQELSLLVVDPISPEKVAVLQQIYSLLLH